MNRSPLRSQWQTLLLFLGVIDSNVVVQHNQQEQWDAKHVGKYGQLYVCHHSARQTRMQEVTMQPSIYSVQGLFRWDDIFPYSNS